MMRVKTLIKWVVIMCVTILVLSFAVDRWRMQRTILNKSGIKISPYYHTIKNVIRHSPTAFDSDYQWLYKIQVTETDMVSISTQIENSRFYNFNKSDGSIGMIQDSLTHNKLDGYWMSNDNKYLFKPSEEKWDESTTIEIDRSERTIEVYLVHL